MAPDGTKNKNSGHTFYRKLTKSSNQQVKYNHQQNKITAMGADEQIFKHHPENDRVMARTFNHQASNQRLCLLPAF
jgi:hypothetical protein